MKQLFALRARLNDEAGAKNQDIATLYRVVYVEGHRLMVISLKSY